MASSSGLDASIHRGNSVEGVVPGSEERGRQARGGGDGLTDVFQIPPSQDVFGVGDSLDISLGFGTSQSGLTCMLCCIC